MTVGQLFVGMKTMTFFSFSQTIYGYRMYLEGVTAPEDALNTSKIYTMPLADF
jgi:hypothetical protein